MTCLIAWIKHLKGVSLRVKIHSEDGLKDLLCIASTPAVTTARLAAVGASTFALAPVHFGSLRDRAAVGARADCRRRRDVYPRDHRHGDHPLFGSLGSAHRPPPRKALGKGFLSRLNRVKPIFSAPAHPAYPQTCFFRSWECGRDTSAIQTQGQDLPCGLQNSPSISRQAPALHNEN